MEPVNFKMNFPYRWSTLVILVLVFTFNTFAQQKVLPTDYQRAIGYLYQNYQNKKIFNTQNEPYWFADSTGFWFAKFAPGEKHYLKVSFPGLEQSDLFDHQKLAQLLSDSLQINANESELPIHNTAYKNKTEIEFSVKNKRYTLNTDTYKLTEKSGPGRSQRAALSSPDTLWEAYNQDYNLYIKSTKTGEKRQLSFDGQKNYEYATWYGWDEVMEGENAERPPHFWVDWSENSEWIYTSILDLRSAKKMYLLDHSIDTLYRPKLLSYYRGSPGDTGMVYVAPVFFNVKTGQKIKIPLPRSTYINTIGVRWSETPGKVYLKYTARGYQKVQLFSFDLNTKTLDTLYTETSPTNIDTFWDVISEESNRLFFLSEKSGWRQLYSLDLSTKKETALTKGAFYINSIERIDVKNNRMYFLASGKEKNINPYYEQLYSISLNGKNVTLLTPEKQNHKVSLSPDGHYFVDNFSTVNTPTSTVLRSTDSGKILVELSHAELADLDDWTPPEIFTAIAHDGKTTIYGAMWKPTNFDPTKKHPVIDAAYTGPHTRVFPTSFSNTLKYQAFAELGFIIVVVDGLGSPGRSKAFHNYSYKNLGGNLEDHVLAIKQLGEKYSWVDTSQVGIFGHSAGGYDAAQALLAYPDFYKVGVASSGDHDHRMEKAWWPEMYMGWPVDSAYHLQSNITMASNLKGKLLLVHGGIDENVNPSATFKLAEALIKADKQFDMLILPSQRHGYQGKYNTYFTKVRWNYFLKHLRGVEPIWDINWE